MRCRQRTADMLPPGSLQPTVAWQPASPRPRPYHPALPGRHPEAVTDLAENCREPSSARNRFKTLREAEGISPSIAHHPLSMTPPSESSIPYGIASRPRPLIATPNSSRR
jgi:hypothetical protein